MIKMNQVPESIVSTGSMPATVCRICSQMARTIAVGGQLQPVSLPEVRFGIG
jgi:hypothetical protein